MGHSAVVDINFARALCREQEKQTVEELARLGTIVCNDKGVLFVGSKPREDRLEAPDGTHRDS